MKPSITTRSTFDIFANSSGSLGSLASRTPPGAELLGVILIYLASRVLAEFPAGHLIVGLRRWWARFWPLGLAHAALILFLATLHSARPGAWLALGLLAAALANLWRHRQQIETIHWITLAAVFLFALTGHWGTVLLITSPLRF